MSLHRAKLHTIFFNGVQFFDSMPPEHLEFTVDVSTTEKGYWDFPEGRVFGVSARFRCSACGDVHTWPIAMFDIDEAELCASE